MAMEHRADLPIWNSGGVRASAKAHGFESAMRTRVNGV
jgi:hypothetical protein